jgi:hypothetical protein
MLVRQQDVDGKLEAEAEAERSKWPLVDIFYGGQSLRRLP